MNLGQLRAALERRTGVAYDSTAANELINDGLRAVAAAGKWPWLFDTQTITLVAGTASYALPAGYLDTRSIVLSDGRRAERIAVEDGDVFSSRQELPTCAYAIEGDEVIFYPTPSAAGTATHRFVRGEEELSSDSDTPLLPATFHPAVVCYAARAVMERLDMPRRADRFEAEYDRWLRTLPTYKHRGGRRTVRTRGW